MRAIKSPGRGFKEATRAGLLFAGWLVRQLHLGIRALHWSGVPLPTCQMLTSAMHVGSVETAVVVLQQVEFLSPADRCPTVVHPQLAVNVFGVGM